VHARSQTPLHTLTKQGAATVGASNGGAVASVGGAPPGVAGGAGAAGGSDVGNASVTAGASSNGTGAAAAGEEEGGARSGGDGKKEALVGINGKTRVEDVLQQEVKEGAGVEGSAQGTQPHAHPSTHTHREGIASASAHVPQASDTRMSSPRGSAAKASVAPAGAAAAGAGVGAWAAAAPMNRMAGNLGSDMGLLSSGAPVLGAVPGGLRSLGPQGAGLATQLAAGFALPHASVPHPAYLAVPGLGGRPGMLPGLLPGGARMGVSMLPSGLAMGGWGGVPTNAMMAMGYGSFTHMDEAAGALALCGMRGQVCLSFHLYVCLSVCVVPWPCPGFMVV